MGSADSDTQASSDEKPQHKVMLGEYLIGKYEVTNAQYAAFAKATYRTWTMPSGKENHPVVNVSWDDAVVFCRWVSQVSGRQVRLPTEAEWEKAARGTDGRIYPWGNSAPDSSKLNFNMNVKDTTVVGKYSPAGDNPYGVADMAGNVWEWTADWYDPNYYANSPASNPQGTSSGQYRVVRGGSLGDNPKGVRAAFRDYRLFNSAFQNYAIGFRLAGVDAPTNTPVPLLMPQTNDLILTLAPGVTMEMVRIPAGEFLMGSTDADKDARSSEKPQHKVTLDEYLISKYEVTNAQYAAYAQAKGLNWSMPQGKENHPVENVSWDDAVAFCAWASQITGRKITLPTEAQWEKAARGTDGRIYPWGNEAPDNTRANFRTSGTTAVGTYPTGKSPYGALDMAGNVYEWTADWYSDTYYASSPASSPQGPTTGQWRVLRGGSWGINSLSVRAASRGCSDPSGRGIAFGFRVAVSAPVP